MYTAPAPALDPCETKERKQKKRKQKTNKKQQLVSLQAETGGTGKAPEAKGFQGIGMATKIYEHRRMGHGETQAPGTQSSSRPQWEVSNVF